MKTTTHSLPVIESLESRLALSGTVIATIAGGVLTLTGDVADNSLTIVETLPDHFTITGGGTTLIKLGAAAAVAMVEFDAHVVSIKGDLKEGNDDIVLTDVDLTKDLTLALGIGTNTVKLTNLFLGGSLSVQGGSGTDTVTLDNLFQVSGKAAFALGDGVNSLVETAAIILVEGALSYTGGNSTDTINLTPSDFISMGSLTVAAGAGDGSLDMGCAGDLLIGGAFSLTTLDHAGVGFTTSLSTGDRLLVAGTVTVKNGVGNNAFTMSAGEALVIGGAVSVTNGNASMASGVSLSSTLITIEGGVTIKNGNGNFSSIIGASSLEIAGAVSITNGNSGSGAGSTSSVSGATVDVHGGVSFVNGSGTFVNAMNGGHVNVGGAIAFTTKDSSAALTTHWSMRFIIW